MRRSHRRFANANPFRRGSLAKGVLVVVGDIPEDQLAEARARWNEMVSRVTVAEPVVFTALRFLRRGRKKTKHERALRAMRSA